MRYYSCKLYIVILLTLFYKSAICQKEGNIWYVGRFGFGLDFNTTPPTILNNGSMREDVNGEPFTMADACGNLLFYKLFNFHHAGSKTPQFNFTSTSNLTLGAGSVFEGSMVATGPPVFTKQAPA